jgi:hypothetical protein
MASPEGYNGRLLGAVNVATVAAAYTVCAIACTMSTWTLTEMLRGPAPVRALMLGGMSVACALATRQAGYAAPAVLWGSIVAVAVGEGAVHDVGAALGFGLAAYISWVYRRDSGLVTVGPADWVTLGALAVSVAGLRTGASWGLPLLETSIVWGTNVPILFA